MYKALTGLALIAAIGCTQPPSHPVQQRGYTAMQLDENSPGVKYVMDKLDNNQTLIMGDTHDINCKSDEIFVAGLLPHFKQHGVENIGLEIPRTHQPEMDDYLATGVLPADPNHFINWVYNKEKGAIMKSARESNMKLWCIDSGGIDEELNPFAEYTRDIDMFEFVKENFISKGKKIAIFVGWWHIAETPYSDGRLLIEPLGALLEEETGSFSIIFDSPIWSISQPLYEIRQNYTGLDFDGTEIGKLPAPADSCGENTTLEECLDGVIFVPHLY
ncbi:MAG: hypothetical protein KJ955_04490 [Nanoarchaeota archaeon]|nr:hypothetical protein [Nanoarchaeota archaeon]